MMTRLTGMDDDEFVAHLAEMEDDEGLYDWWGVTPILLMRFSEFSGLRSSSSALPFAKRSNDDFVSFVAFQTSVVGGDKNKRGVVEAKLKVAINGFGRIGRNFLRCWHGRKDSPLDVIAINDTGGVKQASHLLKYDSTLGIFDADVKPVGTDGISVDGKVIQVVSDRNPANLPWKYV
ncbi:glyceraldehyde-3-phosphate dehydrogenase a chloroplastic [Phtheirospermum japonicum]|uniref:Glyceraldehyde-3-phosphate dehydrogenase a chloroplastic n=1 Tax=Phtheirospermum japonicum TaxID=374723 RepID=A0A830BNF5_9LAMI|nr:glyceraldehyde-3-phosphate dehydrogenase a chloroplastic [Phtheirospermum japonicum]